MSVSDVSVNGFQDSKQSVENGVYRIILDRPTHRNAFSPTLYAEVKRGVLLGEGNPDVVCIVIEGSHGSFGAGGDLKVLLEILALPRDERLAKYIASYCDTTPIGPMLECTKPIIAKIDGLCLAGGLLVSLASDIAIASEGSKFGLPEAKVGLSDRYSATLLPRAIGLTRARYLTFTGALIDAGQAEDWGLILRAVPAEELENEVQRVVDMLRRTSPDAVRAYKHSFNRDIHSANPIDFYTILNGANAQEGLKAFAERRDPIWQR